MFSEHPKFINSIIRFENYVQNYVTNLLKSMRSLWRSETGAVRLEFEGPCGVGPSEAQKIRSSGAPIKFSVVLQGEVLRGRGGVY